MIKSGEVPRENEGKYEPERVVDQPEIGWDEHHYSNGSGVGIGSRTKRIRTRTWPRHFQSLGRFKELKDVVKTEKQPKGVVCGMSN